MGKVFLVGVGGKCGKCGKDEVEGRVRRWEWEWGRGMVEKEKEKGGCGLRNDDGGKWWSEEVVERGCI